MDREDDSILVDSLVMITGRVLRRPIIRHGVGRFSVKIEGSNLFIQGDTATLPDLAQLQSGQEVAVVGYLESFEGKCRQPHGRVAATGVYLLNVPAMSSGIVADILAVWGQKNS